jgi:hypothetical protein
MKEAIHIASGKHISAIDAEYQMYYEIFLCPDCKKVVHLRKSFTQDGEVINASFIHPPRESNDESCRYRIDWVSEPLTVTTFDIHSKRQIFPLLKKHFINVFSSYRIDGINYSLKQDFSYKQKEYQRELVKAASKILIIPSNRGVILKMKDLIHTVGKRSIKNAFVNLPKTDSDDSKRLMIFNPCLFKQKFYDAINRHNANENNIKLTDEQLINCSNFENIIGLNVFLKERLPLFSTAILPIKLDEESLKSSSFSYPSSIRLQKELEFFSFQSHTKISLLVMEFLICAADDSLMQKFMYIIFSKTELLEVAIKRFKPEFLKAVYLTVEKREEQRKKPFNNFYIKLNQEVSKKNIYSNLQVESNYKKFKNFLLFILAEVIIAIVNVNWMRGLPANK